MPDIPASPEEHLALEQRYRDFKAGKPVERDGVRDFILESWSRCHEYFSAQGAPVFQILTAEELEPRRQRSSLVLENAAPVMHSMFELLNGPEEGIKGVKCCVFVTDSQGVLLAKLDNHPFPFRLGMNLNERLIGTSSVHSCMKNRYIATIYGFEHYFEEFSDYVSSSAPVITEDGVVHGAIGVLLHCKDYDLAVKAMSDIAAKAVSSFVNSSIHRLHREFLLDHIDDAIIYTNREQRVLSFNKVAGRIFTRLEEGADILELIPFPPEFKDCLRAGRKLSNFFMPLRNRPGKGMSFYITLSYDNLGGAVLILRRGKEVRELAAQVATSGAIYTFEDIMGTSKALNRAIELARKAAARDMITLISGESGTGKELFAHAIHNAGARAKRPFLIVNCGAMPQGLIQSELFGYEEGTFTGASIRGKMGKFELADSGTIFLDEVGELPLDVQANLLRFLQSGELSKIGSATPPKVDVRIIAATNRNLPELIRQGRFRQDLFYRLNAFPLHIPSLKERGDDVILLAKNFAHTFSLATRGCALALTGESLDNLAAHDWPGNVRELENYIRLHVNLAEGDSLFVPPLLKTHKPDNAAMEGFTGRKDSFERKELSEALQNNQGNIRKAASFLGIPLSTMYCKIKKHKLLPGRLKASDSPPDFAARNREIGQLITRLTPESKESLYLFLKSLV